MSYSEQFNDTVNSLMDPFTANVSFAGALKVFLAVYGLLAAPRLSPKFGPLFSNSFFRIGVMAMIVWVYNHDPALAILIAVSYFLSINYILKNSLKEIAVTRIVTPEIATTISGGSGPGIKTTSVKHAEAIMMQASVNAAHSPGMLMPVLRPTASPYFEDLTTSPLPPMSKMPLPAAPSEVKMTVESHNQIPSAYSAERVLADV
ncbi:hypothetical protein BDK51DRAFT_33568 [Blyttiomyces helicus]|uniref:Uncharacterized protein n=1 Tax=Blyttiomyces helicus TaxID=388810 RepID=A0A4P9WNH8_9FUNG|nr:hypothetical protein BDK51DRAFT_33568 [Blyttiomyces helicus]|eukprot:RKO94514.1 hypothetical protein BDK51DRAFT_33568 [Blyttiomyces helicus]